MERLFITYPKSQTFFNVDHVEEVEVGDSGHSVTVFFTSGRSSKYQGAMALAVSNKASITSSTTRSRRSWRSTPSPRRPAS